MAYCDLPYWGRADTFCMAHCESIENIQYCGAGVLRGTEVYSEVLVLVMCREYYTYVFILMTCDVMYSTDTSGSTAPHMYCTHLYSTRSSLPSLCSRCVRYFVYVVFVLKECYKNGFVYDGLVKVDNKIKHHIINVFAKELTDMSATIAKAELKTLH